MNEKMKILVKNVLMFYGTMLVPLIYGIGLYWIYIGNTLLINLVLRIIGLGVAIFGLIFWYGSYWFLGKSFGVLPREQQKVSKGLYHWFKHPMYLGIMATYLGLAVANQSKTGILFTILILLPMLMLRAKWEERKLISG